MTFRRSASTPMRCCRNLALPQSEIAGAPRCRSGMSDFDPAAHRMIPEQRWFDDFQMGERFVLPSRTMTEALFLAFQAASGDNHPIHYDVEYCRAHGLPGMLAHGFQTLIQTAPGAGLFPFVTEDRSSAFWSSRAGFLSRSSPATRFIRPWRWTSCRPIARPAWLVSAARCTTNGENWRWRGVNAFCCGSVRSIRHTTDPPPRVSGRAAIRSPEPPWTWQSRVVDIEPNHQFIHRSR